MKLMKVAVELCSNTTISDSMYTELSILHKHEDWKTIPMSSSEHILWTRGLGKFKLQKLGEGA